MLSSGSGVTMQIKIHNGYIAIYSHTLVRVLSFGLPNARAVVPFPFCIVFRDTDQEKMTWLVNHEKIHFRQELELLIIGALLLSFFEKMYFQMVLKLNRLEAYKMSSLEQEAYLNQNDPEYLQHRAPYRLFWYLTHKKRFDLVPDRPGEIRMLE